MTKYAMDTSLLLLLTGIDALICENYNAITEFSTTSYYISFKNKIGLRFSMKTLLRYANWQGKINCILFLNLNWYFEHSPLQK